MEDLVATKFFGFSPEQLYLDIYGIGYNEYLVAVTALKETLLEQFPEKREMIKLSCSNMLLSYNEEFDQKWFSYFIQYCSKNIFVIDENTPVYMPELEDVKGNKLAPDRAVNLCHCIMATEYLNIQLLGRLKELDSEIAKRKELLLEIGKTEQKLEVVQKAKELDQRLNLITEVHPEHTLES